MVTVATRPSRIARQTSTSAFAWGLVPTRASPRLRGVTHEDARAIAAIGRWVTSEPMSPVAPAMRCLISVIAPAAQNLEGDALLPREGEVEAVVHQ